jgi:hypothetical protein
MLFSHTLQTRNCETSFDSSHLRQKEGTKHTESFHEYIPKNNKLELGE